MSSRIYQNRLANYTVLPPHEYHDQDSQISEDNFDPPPYIQRKQRRTIWIVAVISVLVNLVFLFLLATSRVLIKSWSQDMQTITIPHLHSPADSAVEYTLKKFTKGSGNDIPIYEQPPSKEVDEAWYDLYKVAPTALHEDEAALLPNATWPIKGNRDQYLISLDVFHQLHCLHTVRQYVDASYYDPSTLTTIDHIRHCIGAIRQALMCAVDVTPVVWQWDEELNRAEQRDDVAHVCRDFGKVRQWAGERWLKGLKKEELMIKPGDEDKAS